MVVNTVSTMKTWLMMRHGKSSWESNVDDLDRPLNNRGIDDAHRMGLFLASENLSFDAAYSSPAIRAAHTALIVAKELALRCISCISVKCCTTLMVIRSLSLFDAFLMIKIQSLHLVIITPVHHFRNPLEE